MAWIEIGGSDIYYVSAGDPAAQTIVFLHGMSSCGEAWWQQFETFGERYHVVAYDSVNHGHSSNSPRGEPEPDRTDELEQFLSALTIERPVLAGNSMGGATILRWAVRHPNVARALVVSGMGIADPASAVPVRAVAPIDPDTLFLPIGNALTDAFKASQPRMFERYLRIRSTATRLEYMRHPRARAASTVAETAALADRVATISSPLLVIVGELDGLRSNAQRLRDAVPGASYVEIPGSPHNNYYETAVEWNDGVANFLNAHDAASSSLDAKGNRR